jgi:pimeloyl-ACP methyl ester carboxylesterase
MHLQKSLFVLAAASALLVSTPAAQAEVIDGVSGAGALWQIRVPDTGCNGDLVVYAHGIEEPSAELRINPDNFPVAAFESFGYAVITSSYRGTGWAIKDAFQDVHQLQSIFQSEVGSANRVYMLGASLGGLVASQQTERFGSQYDGALLFCPPLSGLGAATAYLGDITFLFDVFYPGVLGYDPTLPPVDGTFDVDAMLLNAQFAILSNPLGALQILSVMGGQVPGTNLNEFAESILTAVAFWTVYGEEAYDRANGWAFDNTNRLYAGSFDDAGLNAAIARIASANRAVNYSSHWYEADGDLHVPTVVLTTVADPVVPVANTLQYAATVAGQGASGLLAVETVARYGHCAFSPNEIFGAFFDLVGWVQYGVAPAGGDVTTS